MVGRNDGARLVGPLVEDDEDDAHDRRGPGGLLVPKIEVQLTPGTAGQEVAGRLEMNREFVALLSFFESVAKLCEPVDQRDVAKRRAIQLPRLVNIPNGMGVDVFVT